MNKYATYNFYVNDYKGTLSEELFNSFIIKASKDIERNVNIDLDESVYQTLNAKDQERISYVACELCDYIYNNGDNTGSSPNSISIDGVSLTQSNYSSQNNINTNLNKIYDDLPQSLTRYL